MATSSSSHEAGPGENQGPSSISRGAELEDLVDLTKEEKKAVAEKLQEVVNAAISSNFSAFNGDGSLKRPTRCDILMRIVRLRSGKDTYPGKTLVERMDFPIPDLLSITFEFMKERILKGSGVIGDAELWELMVFLFALLNGYIKLAVISLLGSQDDIRRVLTAYIEALEQVSKETLETFKYFEGYGLKLKQMVDKTRKKKSDKGWKQMEGEVNKAREYLKGQFDLGNQISDVNERITTKSFVAAESLIGEYLKALLDQIESSKKLSSVGSTAGGKASRPSKRRRTNSKEATDSEPDPYQYTFRATGSDLTDTSPGLGTSGFSSASQSQYGSTGGT